MPKCRKEYTDTLLATYIFSMCFNQPKTIEEISRKIYENHHANNIKRIYDCCQILLKYGVIVPVFNDRILKFKVNSEKLNVEMTK